MTILCRQAVRGGKMRKFLLAILIILSLSFPVFATDYTWYFSDDATGDLGEGSDANNCTTTGTPCKSITKMNSLIAGMNNTTDTATLYLDRGDTWTLTSNTGIRVTASNVIIDAYGTGAKPKIDGNASYPTDENAYVISIGESYAGRNISNVSVKNIRIQNLHDGVSLVERGSGIIFDGATYFDDTGSVENCEFQGIGSKAIQIYRVPNPGGTATAIKIENNLIEDARICEGLGVASCTSACQAINANDGYSYGHEARYNVIESSYGEGIGAGGFAVVEYNMITGCKNPSIYYDPRISSVATTTVIRYNLVWGDSDATFKTACIRLDDESATGTNTVKTIEIYGNVVTGALTGGCYDIRNRDGYSHWGSVKIYNNTAIDCYQNFIISRPQEFNAVYFNNNASIIFTEASAKHVEIWGVTSWATWTVGHNFFYNDIVPDAPFSTNAIGPSGVVSLLGKTSGWRSLTTAPSLNDFTPQTGSDMIDNPSTDDLGASYDDYVYTGEWTDLPATESLITTTQGANGEGEFGAIIISSATQTPNQSGNSPVGEIPCGNNPQSYNQSVTTDIPADCKWDTVDTTYALMANTYDTANYTQHTDPQSEACGSGNITHYTRCRNHYDTDQVELSSTTNVFNIGDPPSPQSPTGLGIMSIGSSINNMNLGSGSVGIGLN